jgi:hypothetical protein
MFDVQRSGPSRSEVRTGPLSGMTHLSHPSSISCSQKIVKQMSLLSTFVSMTGRVYITSSAGVGPKYMTDLIVQLLILVFAVNSTFFLSQPFADYTEHQSSKGDIHARNQRTDSSFCCVEHQDIAAAPESTRRRRSEDIPGPFVKQSITAHTRSL